MSRFGSIMVLSIAIGALPNGTVSAGTILKLNLGSDADPDIEFSGGVLKTLNDGVGATTGDQNTSAEFMDFMNDENLDIPSGASFTMNNLTAAVPAKTFGPLVIQNFTGGFLRLYSPTDVLLLEGTLGNSALTGPVGAPGTGALFTTAFVAITNGTLKPKILANTLTMSMSLTNINGGTGFVVTGTAPSEVLGNFQANVTSNITGRPVPEPAALGLLLFSALALGMGRVRRPLRG